MFHPLTNGRKGGKRLLARPFCVSVHNRIPKWHSNRIFIFYPDPLGNHPIWLDYIFFQNGWLNHIDIEFGETICHWTIHIGDMPQVFAAHARPKTVALPPCCHRAEVEVTWRNHTAGLLRWSNMAMANPTIWRMYFLLEKGGISM